MSYPADDYESEAAYDPYAYPGDYDMHTGDPKQDLAYERQYEQQTYQVIPEVIKNFIQYFHKTVSDLIDQKVYELQASRVSSDVIDQKVYEIQDIYENSWTKLTERFFKNTPWPEAETIAPQVGNDAVFLILYKELYYRHIYAKVSGGPSLEQRFESYYNYCNLFNYILNADGPAPLELPMPPPPSRDEDEEAAAGGDCIGSTVYSKHWLFGVLSGLIQMVSPENAKSSSDDEEQQMELDEEMENEICRVWDMSMDEDVALFLQEFNAPDIFMGVLAKSKCPRLREICVGILGNMACFQEICVSISSDKNLGQVLLHCLYDSDPPTLLETSRLLLTCLSQTEVASVWVERIRENPAIYDSICFIMSSSTNVDLLVKVGEVVDKLFDLDEKLMLEWIKSGAVQALDQPQEDSEQQPVFRIVPCVLEAAKQVRSENPEGLDVYMHILQLLTTVDDGIQAIVQCPDTGKDTWNLLFDLVCHEFCQSDDPPIILQEQKTVLASVFSVLSAIYASQTEQEYLKIGKVDLPLIDSLIRVLQNMEHCQKKPENSVESNTEETKKSDLTQEDFHLKILKDISCEFLSNIFQVLTKETITQGLKEGQLSKQKCSCAFENLLPFYSPVVEDFLKILREVDKTLAGNLEEGFPSLKIQT